MKFIFAYWTGLMFFMGMALPASAVSTVIQLRPTEMADVPVTVRDDGPGSDPRFTVFLAVATNDPFASQFLHARLEVRDEDHQLMECEVENHWITGGVEFSFSVAPALLEASRFYLIENEPMPAFVEYWFFLRDFATNHTPASTSFRSSKISPGILRELPRRIKKLRPGTKGAAVWPQLRLSENGLGGGYSLPERDMFWINDCEQLELDFEEQPPKPFSAWASVDDRKLIRAILYKNGRPIAESRK